jgi:hypothetical protein
MYVVPPLSFWILSIMITSAFLTARLRSYSTLTPRVWR